MIFISLVIEHLGVPGAKVSKKRQTLVFKLAGVLSFFCPLRLFERTIELHKRIIGHGFAE